MKNAALIALSILSLGFSAHADIVKCTSTHLGKADDLVVYIARSGNEKSGSANVVLGRKANRDEEAVIVAHFRGDQGETGFDADNGIQLLVAGRPEKREEKDGASARRVFLGNNLDKINDMHIYWRPSMETSQSFITQIRADMKKLGSSVEPRANTLSCSSVSSQRLSNPEELHSFAESDLDIKK